MATGTGEQKTVTFSGSGGTLSVNGGCSDSGKSVTINVIVPQIDEVAFVSASGANAYDIYDGTDRWCQARAGQTAENDPGCFKKAGESAVRVKFWHSQNLTFSTNVKIWGDVDFWDEDTTGGNYPEEYMTFGATDWPSPSTGNIIISPSTIQDFVHRDSVDIRWEYKVPWGTNSWIETGNSYNLEYYIVFDSPKCSLSDYKKMNVYNAIQRCWVQDTEPAIASKANDSVADGVFGGCICNSGFQTNFDAAMGVYPATPPKGMCCCRAEGLNCVLQVIGIGPYTHDYVNEHSEPNPQLVYYHDCTTCGVRVYRAYWDGIWNGWEGVIKAGGVGSTCYAPDSGQIGIDEGTYTQIKNAISSNLGFYWQNGPLSKDICTHYGPP